MYAQVAKPKEDKSRAIANSVALKKSSVKQGFGFVDNRPVVAVQRKLSESITAKQSTQGISRGAVIQRAIPKSTDEWNGEIGRFDYTVDHTVDEWVAFLTSKDTDGNTFVKSTDRILINSCRAVTPDFLKTRLLAAPDWLNTTCTLSKNIFDGFKSPTAYRNDIDTAFTTLSSGGANTTPFLGKESGNYPESAGGNVKPEKVEDKWKAFLGGAPYGKKHPRTGVDDPERITSTDGTKTIRYGNHERTSTDNKHHYHDESWTLNGGTDKVDVDNKIKRVPLQDLKVITIG